MNLIVNFGIYHTSFMILCKLYVWYLSLFLTRLDKTNVLPDFQDAANFKWKL